MNPVAASPRLHLAILAAAAAVFAWSGWMPRDRMTWVLEVAPAVAAAAILAGLYPRWRFTPLVLVLIGVHAIVLMVGGKYTYAEVPAFNWLRDEFGLARNYYDRVGHFLQGFVPAMVAREVLLRNRVVARGPWLFTFATAICLAFSAFYEMIEWWVALASQEAAEAFLGTQGDVWDTQWDMFLALVGAMLAQLLLGRAHDRELGLAGPLPGPLAFREVSDANIDAVSGLRLGRGQERLVASMGKSFWLAARHEGIRYRAVVSGETVVGFVLVADRPREAGGHEVHLARLLVDADWQGRGIGRRVLERVVAEARERPGCAGVRLSFVAANGRAARLCERAGFRRTGVIGEDGEHEMWLGFGNP